MDNQKFKDVLQQTVTDALDNMALPASHFNTLEVDLFTNNQDATVEVHLRVNTDTIREGIVCSSMQAALNFIKVMTPDTITLITADGTYFNLTLED